MLSSIRITHIFVSLGFKYYLGRFNVRQNLKKSLPFDLTGSALNRFGLYAFLNQHFAETYLSLLNKKLKTKEINLLNQMSLFIGSFDDLMDDHGMDRSVIFEKIKTRGKENVDNLSLNICRQTYHTILEHHPNQSLFENFLGLGTEAQDRDIKVRVEDTEISDLFDIMGDKGGYSLLLILSSLEDYEESHQKAIYSLGSLIQFANDVFDIYKDSRVSEWTYATNLKDMNVLLESYRMDLENCFNDWSALSFDESRFQKFWMSNYSLLCRAEIAIEQFIDNDALSKSEMTRADWICDMERIGNVLKNYRLVLKWFRDHRSEILDD